jgi:hypothetical protein
MEGGHSMVVIPIKLLMVQLLDGRITINGEPVEVLTEFTPEPELNCITMNADPALNSKSTFYYYRKTKLNPGDVGYDPSNPDLQIVTRKVRWDVYEDSVSLHVWAKTNEVRDHIVMQVNEIITQAKMHHYKYCSRYNPTTGICSTTGQQCDASSRETAHSIEGRCPYPDIVDPESPQYRNPMSYFQETGIRIESLISRGATNVDQLDMVPEVYHTAVNFDYTMDKETIVDVSPLLDVTVHRN